MFFELLFAPFFYFFVAFFFVGIVLLLFFFNRNKKFFFWIGLFCKFLFLALLFLFFLQPYFLEKKPSSDNFSVAVLGDISKSMETKDCIENTSRLQILNILLRETTNQYFSLPLKKIANFLEKNYSLQNYDFVATLKPSFSFRSTLPFFSQEGNTDLANVLAEIEQKQKINSIFLFSDGITPSEKKVFSVVEKLKQKKIIVNTIGIGEKKKIDDLQVSFYKPPKKVQKNTQFDLKVQIKNFFPYKITTEIEIFENEFSIEKKEVTLKAFSTNVYQFQQVAFDHEKKFYKVKIPLQQKEILSYNNIDYATVKVKGSKKYNFFYYSEELSQEYKYLNQIPLKDKNLRITSLIALDEKKYFTKEGVKQNKEAEIFFSVKNLMNQQIIILGKIKKDSYFFNKKNRYIQNFKSALNQKGVGLLVYAQNFENNVLRKILSQEMQQDNFFYNRQQQNLSFQKKSIFLKKQKKFFLENPVQLPINKNVSYFSQNKKKWNYDLFFGEQFFLKYRSTGVGKTAILGIPTAQWFAQNNNFYRQFWYSLFDYLLTPTPEKITFLNHHKKYSDEEIDLTVDVLNENLLGDNKATVKIDLINPEGEKKQSFFLQHSSKILGRYQKTFFPSVKGEYQVKVTVEKKNKKEEITSSFLVHHANIEAEYHPLNESLLKKISSETGGKYYHYRDDFSSEEKISILTADSWLEEKKEIFTNWVFLLLLFLLLFFFWYIRRSIGMK